MDKNIHSSFFMGKIEKTYSKPPRETVWEWVCNNIDWSGEPRYRAAWPGKFNPDLLPFYREPLDAFLLPSVREIVLIKPTQAGGSENMILMPMRWAVANSNKAMLYASAQQERTEEFFIERIKRGMNVFPQGRQLALTAVERGYVYDIGNSQIVCTWSKSGSGFKQRPFDWCFGDEVSAWPDVSVVDEMRKRMATRAHGKLVLISSLDLRQRRPTDEDPIWIEYQDSDKRTWVMPDPGKSGGVFSFEMGTPDTTFGLKWSANTKREDGTHDYNKVFQSAHYVTPAGAVLRTRRERLAAVQAGYWQPNKADGSPGKRGYHFNQFLLPFDCGDFGEIAVRFLQSQDKGSESLRAFVYEVLAEPWKEHYLQPADNTLAKVAGAYKQGTVWCESDDYREKYKELKPHVFCTVDVQKRSFYYVLRAWVAGGHSALIKWGEVESLDDVWSAASPYFAKYPGRALIDNSYPNRQHEVRWWCHERWRQDKTAGNCWLPVYGRDHIFQDVTEAKRDFVNEGQAGDQKIFIWSYTFRPSAFKARLMDRMNQLVKAEWLVYRGIEFKYANQATSEECVEGKWKIRRGRTDNHLWDCEVMQMVAAQLGGLV